MTTPAREPGQQPPAESPEPTPRGARWGSMERRRDRVHAEVARARAGGHRVPTWVLAVVLGVLVLGWLYLIISA